MHVLITGAASGIGRSAADFFIERGHQVYGIDIAPAQQYAGYHGFSADITDADSLVPVQTYLSENHVVLDAILNIAGVHKMASLVECDYGSMKRLLDINLAGAMLVNRMFHGCLRPSGRIVIVTSEVAGMDPMPFNGLYNVSKTALDTYAQALRQELNLIGQKVITVRPGAVETPLCHGSVRSTADLADTTVLYRKQAKRFSGLAAAFMGKPMKPASLASVIYKATTAKHPKLIYHKHRNKGLVLLSILPKRMQCWVIKSLLKLDF